MSEITEEEIASIIRSYMDDLRADIYFDIYDKEVAAAGAAATVLALLHPALERARVEAAEQKASHQWTNEDLERWKAEASAPLEINKIGKPIP